jgi:hypothetical protein
MDILYSLTTEDFIIEKQVFIQALNLVDYFNLHKIVLAGYKINNMNLDLFINEIINKQ